MLVHLSDMGGSCEYAYVPMGNGRLLYHVKRGQAYFKHTRCTCRLYGCCLYFFPFSKSFLHLSYTCTGQYITRKYNKIKVLITHYMWSVRIIHELMVHAYVQRIRYIYYTW